MKDGTEEKVFDALEWLVPPLAGCSHIPDRGEQRVGNYGYYLTCPKRQGRMRTVSFIEDRELIKAIFKHLSPSLGFIVDSYLIRLL